MSDEEEKNTQEGKPPEPKELSFESAKIYHLTRSGVKTPCLEYKGEMAEEGTTIIFKNSNGISYKGIVSSCLGEGGICLLEFSDGLNPI